MDTEQLLLFHGNGPSFESYRKLDPNDLACVEKHVEFARHIKEIYGLFRVFLCNIEALRGEYELYSSGSAFHNGQPADTEDDYYKVITLGESESFEIHRLGDLARVFNGPRFKRPYADLGVTSGPSIRKYFTGTALTQLNSDNVKYLDSAKASPQVKNSLTH